MDEISVVIQDRSNFTDSTWWLQLLEPDGAPPIPLDSTEGGLWSGNFVPPPPRPVYLEEGVSTDGLTTCDLCSWAWKNTRSLATDNITLGAATKVEWVVTLVVVSLISAVVGAAVMVTVLYCRRIKNTVANDDGSGVQRPPIATPDDKVISLTHSNLNSQSKGIWSCIFRNVTSTTQLDAPPASSTENHYTHMDEAYNSTDEALYAELDRYSTNSPAYQNTGYTDPDIPSSSAPSSAYYSDLSVNTVNDRTYEIVGLATTTDWEINDPQRKSAVKLSSISETVTVPSDYV
uniref:Uncharacterized protein n=2 Tax=Photinus pyralis TaxID=7054 RepID=A0A1Y1MNB2_PHOPY